jgi:ATP-binding cassette subfamily C protein
MAEASLIERIGGDHFETGAHEPILLDEPARCYYVEQGYLDVFAVPYRGEQVIGRRLFVARVPEEGVAFGARSVAGRNGEERCVLQAVPSMNAVLVECRRDGINAETFDLTTVVWIEEWLFGLSEFLAQGRPPPRTAQLLEADLDVPYPEGEALSAYHGDLVWASADRSARLIGQRDMMVPPEEGILPVSERIWIELDADAKVSGMHTPTALVTEQLWPAFDRFNVRILQFAAGASTRAVEASNERRMHAYTARLTSVARALERLAVVLNGATGEYAADAAGGWTPLQTVVNLILQSQGVIHDVSGDGEEESRQPRVRPGTASGIRLRNIALESRWWLRDGPSFVGYTTDERPLALLSNGRGGYRVVDPERGEAAVVGDREAAAIAHYGVVLYPPLPDEVKDGKTALRYALRGHGRDLRIVLVMAVFGALVALVTPVLTGRLLSEIIPRVDTSMWIAALAAMLLSALGSAVFEVVRALSLLRIEGRVDEQLQAAVWSRLIALPAPFFRDFSAGDLADRANGISQIRQLLTGATVGAVLGGVFSLFSLALLFHYSWSLALVATLILLVLIGATWIFSRGQMRHHRVSFRIQGVIDGIVFQIITGLAKIRVASAEGYALDLWARRFADQRRATLAARRWAAGQFTVNSIFQPLAAIALFAYVYYALVEGETQPSFDLGDFLSFNAAFGQLLAAMTGLTSAVTTVVAAIPLFERVQPILAAQSETAAGGSDPGDLTGDIEFANVTFRYLPEGPNAVEDISFRVRAGEYVAFVGTSGSGKSTIYRLLLGFESLESGAVFLDGHDLAQLNLPAVRSHMGVVLQDGQLVAGSIFENIVGSSALTVEDAWRAAAAAALDEDIKAMPMGMHTVLPEGAAGLSGGQKQRLLIARALVHRPRILLFDEATSALDNRTQEIVQESLGRLSATRVVIAHRLSTIRDVDRIYVLEAGRIVESGRYDDLMNRGGAFAALAKRQVV